MVPKDWATGRTMTPGSSRIPIFENIDDEAAFWDSHSSSEFADELEDVTGQVSFRVNSPDETIVVRLDHDAIEALNDRARIEHTDPTSLVRQWVIERLRAS